MSVQNTIHVCVDHLLEDEKIVVASETAINENPINRPAFQFTPGLGVAPISRFDLAAITGKKWENGRMLRVFFMDGDSSVQEKIISFAKAWSQHANINLDFSNDPDAEIRVSFQFTGSWSYIGTDCLSIPKNKPTMNFGWLTENSREIEYSRVVTHEFGHALGCYHEHQHPQNSIPWDKEAVYDYYMGAPNNWSKSKVDQNLFKKYSENISQFSEFDPSSIMLYAIPTKFTVGDFEVDWNSKLSETDKNFISVMYPKQPKDSATLEINDKPVRTDIGTHGEEDPYTFVVAHHGKHRIETGGWTDLVLLLYGPDDPKTFVAMDDDSGFWRNARIDAELKPGKYQIIVRHFKPRGTGKYTIAVKLLK